MKKGLLLLLTIVLLMGGCEEGAQYMGSTGLAACKNNVMLASFYAEGKMRYGDQSASNALSAWCWLADCVEMLNMTIGDNKELDVLMKDLQTACGTCRLTSGWHPGDFEDPNRQRIVDNIDYFCSQHAKHKQKDYGD